MSWTLKDLATGKDRQFESRAQAEEQQEELEALGSEIELIPPDGTENGTEPEQVEEPNEPMSDNTEDTEPELVEQPNDTDIVDTGIDHDPLNTLPKWMLTQVDYSGRGDTSTTVNKRGCQVIAAHLNLEYDTEAITRASESDFEYAEFKCVVEKPDGRTYTGHGTALADGNDQPEDSKWTLDMQAETRAYKRAVKGATGGGIEAFAGDQ